MECEVTFLSFGDSKKYSKDLNRISTEASNFSRINHVTIFNETNLGKTFFDLHGEFILKQPKGFGCFLWKPFIIGNVLESLKENDILVYADAGCHLNNKGIPRFDEYIKILERVSLLGFELAHENHLYTKRKCFEVLDPALRFFNEKMIAAGVLLIKKNQSSVDFVQRWKEYSFNYDLIGDYSDESNHDTFLNHRHDQSILSLLVRDCSHIKLIKDETWHKNFYRHGRHYPLLAVRGCSKVIKFLKYPYPLNYILAKFAQN
jgi:hypothetical protein